MAELPSISYSTSTTSAPIAMNFLTTAGTNIGGTLADWKFDYTAPFVPCGRVETLASAPQVKERILARLIRFTVVDQNPILADKAPELSIVMEGTQVLNGTDDKGFLMELAPKLAERLIVHNPKRVLVEYEDKDGKTRNLKETKLSNLDVVIEVLREYK